MRNVFSICLSAGDLNPGVGTLLFSILSNCIKTKILKKKKIISREILFSFGYYYHDASPCMYSVYLCTVVRQVDFDKRVGRTKPLLLQYISLRNKISRVWSRTENIKFASLPTICQSAITFGQYVIVMCAPIIHTCVLCALWLLSWLRIMSFWFECRVI